MATSLNPYRNIQYKTLHPKYAFNGETFSNDNEVELYNNLQSEGCSIYGIKCTYLLRSINTLDPIYGETLGSCFKDSFDIAMMPENTELTMGQDTIEEFGYSIQDTLVLHCPVDIIHGLIKDMNNPDRIYPQVGDLIHVPSLYSLWRINYINSRASNLQQGAYRYYVFTCQMWDAGSEKFDTGNELIDSLNTVAKDYDEPYIDNQQIQEEANLSIVPGETYPEDWANLLNSDSITELLTTTTNKNTNGE